MAKYNAFYVHILVANSRNYIKAKKEVKEVNRTKIELRVYRIISLETSIAKQRHSHLSFAFH